VAGITSLLSNWMFNLEISNINNLSWMKRIDNYSFYFMNNSWGYGREGVGNDRETLVSEETNVNFELLQILVN
jgi:hypothetical protein